MIVHVEALKVRFCDDSTLWPWNIKPFGPDMLEIKASRCPQVRDKKGILAISLTAYFFPAYYTPFRSISPSKSLILYLTVKKRENWKGSAAAKISAVSFTRQKPGQLVHAANAYFHSSAKFAQCIAIAPYLNM